MLEFKAKETVEELERTKSILDGFQKVEGKKKGGD
jgi:hypothetical protein